MNSYNPKANSEAPPRPTRYLDTTENDDAALDQESINLSPERISDGESTTTFILHKILEQDLKSHDFRHWGINE